ncbi:unnamed protein product [Bursaphelenchus okinawaensis]|uniref:Uncharacterized protein n=1 Tax=Bursaphelenchus okinawaensis TaxID=465554 RepID=A0A811KTB9_9BILA|nr:unnamed protein product [Bursaphelenchus okinawaensis]CAG9109771.1 unnamed protein product [Bursaphelenchus okinawaensis]
MCGYRIISCTTSPAAFWGPKTTPNSRKRSSHQPVDSDNPTEKYSTVATNPSAAGGGDCAKTTILDADEKPRPGSRLTAESSSAAYASTSQTSQESKNEESQRLQQLEQALNTALLQQLQQLQQQPGISGSQGQLNALLGALTAPNSNMSSQEIHRLAYE